MFTVSCGAIICLLLDLLRIIFKSGRKKIPVGLKKMTSRKVEPGMDSLTNSIIQLLAILIILLTVKAILLILLIVFKL